MLFPSNFAFVFDKFFFSFSILFLGSAIKKKVSLNGNRVEISVLYLLFLFYKCNHGSRRSIEPALCLTSGEYLLNRRWPGLAWPRAGHGG